MLDYLYRIDIGISQYLQTDAYFNVRSPDYVLSYILLIISYFLLYLLRYKTSARKHENFLKRNYQARKELFEQHIEENFSDPIV